MNDYKFATSMDFFNSYEKLDSSLRKKVITFIDKFQKNPNAKGFNLEKILSKSKLHIYSARVDTDYRTILTIEGECYVFLYVDHHDEAYEWAKNKVIEINKEGLISIYTVVDCNIKQNKPHIFDKYTDKQLMDLGVPEAQLSYLRSFEERYEFYNARNNFCKNIYELLELLLNGDDYEDVLSLIKDKPNKDQSLSECLKLDINSNSFTLIEDFIEFENAINNPIELWRVFLHPNQKALVNKDFKGSFKVTGEAGTGKTVVAMHRAKYLLKKGSKVLFTTFTSNLANDIDLNINKILSSKEIKKLDIESIDSIIHNYILSIGIKSKLEFDYNNLINYWNLAIKGSKTELCYKESFYFNEWSLIATSMDDLCVQSYLSIPRVGRKERLTREERIQVWNVFEEYMSILKKEDVLDIDYATYIARDNLKKHFTYTYDSIIIDEGQDISPNMYKFLRAYVGEERPNDLFIVGDNHQRIYKHKAVLSRCGINVRGRSAILRTNYRTTKETRDYAINVLKDIDFTDLDGEQLKKYSCNSITNGEKPTVLNFPTYENQIEYIVKTIKELNNYGVFNREICIITKTHKEVDKLLKSFDSMQVQCEEIKNHEAVSSYNNGLKVSTMHRVKGLEFKYVFIVSLNKEFDFNDDGDVINKCLLYVSLTRAQNKAYILSYGEPSKLVEW